MAEKSKLSRPTVRDIELELEMVGVDEPSRFDMLREIRRNQALVAPGKVEKAIIFDAIEEAYGSLKNFFREEAPKAIERGVQEETDILERQFDRRRMRKEIEQSDDPKLKEMFEELKKIRSQRKILG